MTLDELEAMTAPEAGAEPQWMSAPRRRCEPDFHATQPIEAPICRTPDHRRASSDGKAMWRCRRSRRMPKLRRCRRDSQGMAEAETPGRAGRVGLDDDFAEVIARATRVTTQSATTMPMLPSRPRAPRRRSRRHAVSEAPVAAHDDSASGPRRSTSTRPHRRQSAARDSPSSAATPRRRRRKRRKSLPRIPSLWATRRRWTRRRRLPRTMTGRGRGRGRGSSRSQRPTSRSRRTRAAMPERPRPRSAAPKAQANDPPIRTARSTPTDLDDDLLDIFLEEGGDILDHSDGLLARLREAPDDRELVVGLQRDLHTLKGGARMAGIYRRRRSRPRDGIAARSRWPKAAANSTPTGVVVLERGFDRLHGMVTRVGERKAIALPAEPDRPDRRLRRPQRKPRPPPSRRRRGRRRRSTPSPPPDAAPIAGSRSAASPASPLSAPIEGLGEEDDVRRPRAAGTGPHPRRPARPPRQLRRRGRHLPRAPRAAARRVPRQPRRTRPDRRRDCASSCASSTSRPRRRSSRATSARARPTTSASIRSSSTASRTLQQLSRALAESAADLVSLQGSLDDLTRQYETLLLQQSRVSSDLQEGLMRTRMVPFDALVPRLRRVLRQAASETGKQAQLKVDGAQRRNGPQRARPHDRAARAHAAQRARARPRNAGRAPQGEASRRKARSASRCAAKGPKSCSRSPTTAAAWTRDAIRARRSSAACMKPDARAVRPRPVRLDPRNRLLHRRDGQPAGRPRRRHGRGAQRNPPARRLAARSSPSRARARTFTIRLPFTLAVTQAVFVKIGDTSFAVPMASVQGVGRIARDELDKRSRRAAGVQLRRRGLRDPRPRQAARRTHHGEGAGQPADAAAAGALRRPARRDRDRPGARQPRNRGQAGRPAGQLGAGHLRRDDHGRRPRRHDSRRRAAGAPPGRASPRDAERRSQPAPAPVAQRVPLVMVVDDSITMRKVTGRVLERNDMEVLTAKDGVDAVEKMAERVPDLMLLDIEMPRMDGYELATEHERATRACSDVPIIMITSRTGEKHRQRAMDIGVDRYLGKPYQEAELMRNVFEMLGHGARSVTEPACASPCWRARARRATSCTARSEEAGAVIVAEGDPGELDPKTRCAKLRRTCSWSASSRRSSRRSSASTALLGDADGVEVMFDDAEVDRQARRLGPQALGAPPRRQAARQRRCLPPAPEGALRSAKHDAPAMPACCCSRACRRRRRN